MSRSGEARIDGVAVAVEPGESILAAARRAGIAIPTLCHGDGLHPEGGCRVCLVEVEGARRPLAACCSEIVPGMVVTATSDRLHVLRRGILELIANAPGLDGARVASADTEFARLLAAHDVAPRTADRAAAAVASHHPYLRFDPSLCVACRRCDHACAEIQGSSVFSFGGRGAATHLLIGAAQDFSASPCVACGACVDHCPSGALSDVDRLAPRPGESRRTSSVCGYCGVGCRVEVETHEDRVLAIRGVEDAAVNRGHLCAKGRYAHAWQRSGERLTRPLRRTGDGFTAISWEEALAFAADRLAAIHAAHGGGAIGVMTSSRSTNEAAYLLQRLFRTRFATNNVDCCARVCHSSTALALERTTGTGAATTSYGDIEMARSIVIAGANPTEAHPVLGARILEARLRGARLMVIDPRRIELAEFADVHVPLRPGSNVAFFNAVARRLIASGAQGAIDRAYLAARVEGFAAFAAFVASQDEDALLASAGIDRETLDRAAGFLAAGPALFVHGLGLSELEQGVASVESLVNLGLLTGSIGRAGAGMMPLRGQNNVQGNADMGAMPNRITGYQRLDDPRARERCRREWGEAPPIAPGLTVPAMLEAAADGDLRALWIQGEDPAQSDPCESRVVAGLEALELLVVQEMFLTETAKRAHLVLPAASVFEQDGTFTNAERRIQRVRAAVAPPGEARPDWRVARDLGIALGRPPHESALDPAAIFEEIARLAPESFGGVSYARLDASRDGLQWPCADARDPGTSRVHESGFVRGKARLTCVAYRDSSEHGIDGYPYLLVTGRELHHYNVGSMTRRTAQTALAGGDRLELAPEDAAREGVASGDRVVLESRHGAIEVEVKTTPRIAPGTLFLTFHDPATHANRVVTPALDPESNCPQYKATAARLRPPRVP
jgi:formate dehydrogenase major subunit